MAATSSKTRVVACWSTSPGCARPSRTCGVGAGSARQPDAQHGHPFRPHPSPGAWLPWGWGSFPGNSPAAPLVLLDMSKVRNSAEGLYDGWPCSIIAADDPRGVLLSIAIDDPVRGRIYTCGIYNGEASAWEWLADTFARLRSRNTYPLVEPPGIAPPPPR